MELQKRRFPQDYVLLPDQSEIGYFIVSRKSDGKSFKINIEKLTDEIGITSGGGAPIYFVNNILPSLDNTGQPITKGGWVILSEGSYINVLGQPNLEVPEDNLGIGQFNGSAWVLVRLIPLPDSNPIVSEIVAYEGYIESSDNIIKAANVDDSAFTTGKVYVLGIPSDYSNGAISKIDKTKMVKLIGGGTYKVELKWVTNNAETLLLDDNLTVNNKFSVALGNATKAGDFIEFTIDITNNIGNYYLAFSTKYINSVIDKDISVSNDFFKIERKASDSKFGVVKVDGVTIKSNGGVLEVPSANELKEISDYEGYIKSKTINLSTAPNSSFTKGKVYVLGVLSDYTNGAVSNIDKSTMVKLTGGILYKVESPYVTNTSEVLLLNDNLEIIKNYSILNSNVIRNGNYIDFNVDLSALSGGDYYLAFSTFYTSSTDVINKNISIHNDFSKKESKASTTEYGVVKVDGVTIKSTGGVLEVPYAKDIYDYEGYVAAKIVNLSTSDNSSFIKGKVYVSGVEVDYTTGAVLKKDVSVMPKLIGGGVYNAYSPFVTNNTEVLLLDQSLTIIERFSVGRSNAVQEGSFLKATIDLSAYSGNYYLAFSTKYNQNTDVVDKNISISNSLFKPYVSSQITVSEEKNNLKNQPNSLGSIKVIEGVYGSQTAKYSINKIKPNSRVSMRFKFRKDLTNVASIVKSPFISIYQNETLVVNAGALKAPCSLNKQQYVTDGVTYISSPKYNCGYYFNTSDFPLEERLYNPIKGEKFFMMWYKGVKNRTTFPTGAKLTERSLQLQAIQDLCIKIESDTFSVLRDGIAVDDSQFNGGATSTIFSTSLKSGGSWKTLQNFYKELTDASVLSEFHFEFFNLSSRLTCESIIQCGKVKLIGRYNQQVEQQSQSLDYYYDSYPFFFVNKIDFKEHTLDLVSNPSGGFKMFIDGVLIGSNTQGNSLRFGGDVDVYFYNLELYNENFGDAELTATNIISSRTPYVVGLMGHGFRDNFEEPISNPNDISQTFTRLADVTKLAIEKGYVIYSAKDITEWANGRKKLNKKAAFYMFDDTYVQIGYLDSIRLRMSYNQYSVPVNFAVIMNYYDTIANKSELLNKFISLRLNGNDLVNHSKYHEVAMPRKNSVMLYMELRQMQQLANEMHIYPDMFVYNWSGEFTPTYEIMSICGFNCAVNSSGNFSTNMTNRYKINRLNMSDVELYSNIEKFLI